MTNVRVPPQDLETERALLGALLLNQNAMYEVADVVGTDSFYAGKHRTIFDAMTALYSKGEPIDVVTLSAKLKERKQLNDIGGTAYLSELAATAASPGSARHYAQVVQTKAMLRALINAASAIGELGFQEERDIEEVLDEAQAAVFAVTQTPMLRTFTEIGEELKGAMERFEFLKQHHGSMRGVPTGFAQLDNLLAGLQKSDLIILAARPSIGKTALALDIARQTAVKHKTPVGIFSLEMSSQQLVDRMLAAQAGINSWKLRTGKISKDDEYERLQNGISELSEAPIYIDDKPGTTVLAMRSVARRLKMEKQLGLVIVDYLQLIIPSGNRSNDSMVQQVTEISRALKGMARELEVPVLALSQLSRAVEQRGGRPRLSDLRDSGCLTGDTLVLRTDTGERVPIKNIVGQTNIPILSLDSSFRLRPMLAAKIFSSGIKQTFEMRTRSGRVIRASGNHPFLTLHGWQRLDALAEDDRIAIPRQIKTNGVPEKRLTRQELILLAHLLGDGCVLPKQPVHYTSADPENLAVVENAASQLFGISPRRVAQKNWCHTYLPTPYRLARGKRHPIMKWFETLGIQPVRSYQKRVPTSVFQSTNDDICLFLHHLWATDGNISWKLLEGRKPAGAIYYSSTSKILAQDVQHLLLRLGILSTLRIVPQGVHRQSHQVHVQGAFEQLSFLTQVGCHGSRGRIVPELITALEAIVPNTNTDTVPPDVWDILIKPAKEELGIGWRGVATVLGVAYNGSAMMTAGVSRARLATIAQALQSETLKNLAKSDVYWDEIVSITPHGEEEVFDMTVPGTHNFVANDFVVHNSIEQDADVVMFIHRENMVGNRTENNDHNNVAQILIEKHRNGPIGKVDLLFDEEKTTFLPVETSSFGDFEQTQAHVDMNTGEPF